MATTALTRKRWGGGGLLLLALLVLLLLAPLLKHAGQGHPLASRDRIDVCALLPAGLLAEAPGTTARAGTDACDVVDAQGAQWLGVGVGTLRSMGADRRHGTREAYDTWLKEVRASGAINLREQAGPWQAGATYRLGTREQLLFEDEGVLVSLSSERLDAAALARKGAAVAAALRAQDSTSSK